MKKFADFLIRTLVAGLLILAPIYLTILILLKAMNSLMQLMKPIAGMLPEWLPAEKVLSLILVLILCFLIGLSVRSRPGRKLWDSIERTFFNKVPGYALFRSLSQQLAGKSQDETWKPAMIQFDDGLAPGFIIEELPDGRYTVFVPSVPTPLAGAVYVMTPDRVHIVDVPFTQAISTVSRWGSGAQAMVAAMDRGKMP